MPEYHHLTIEHATYSTGDAEITACFCDCGWNGMPLHADDNDVQKMTAAWVAHASEEEPTMPADLTDLLAQHRRVAEEHKNCGRRGCRDFVKANDPDVALALNAVASAGDGLHASLNAEGLPTWKSMEQLFLELDHLHEVLQAKMGDADV